MYERFTHTNKNIFLVSMQDEPHPFFSDLLLRGCRKMIDENKRILFIANKKGFDSGIICTSCGYIPMCTQCDIAISYHKVTSNKSKVESQTIQQNIPTTFDFTTLGLSTLVGLCHICKTQYDLPTDCPECHKPRLKPYGLGIQKAAELLRQEFFPPSHPSRGVGGEVLEITADIANSLPKIKKLTTLLDQHHIIIGTSLLTQPPRDWTPDLVVILQADTGLHIPDFTASAKNFWFLHEIFTKYKTPNFIVQTHAADHPSIRAACKLDAQEFLTHDDMFRKEHLYPPHGDICLLLYKHEIEKNLHTKVNTVHQELLFLQQKYDRPDIQVYTTPPLVYKMFGKYRYTIILKGKDLRPFLDIIVSKLDLLKRGFKVDWQADGIT